MDRQIEIRKIWQERFGDSSQWMTDVFTRVYREDEAMLLAEGNKAVSSLLLRKYMLRYGVVKLPMGYVYGAATSREMQGRGFMSRLMRNAIEAGFRRGDLVMSLIPASSSLYDFYARFNFATVFYVDEQRYTARHKFVCDSDDYAVEETVSDPDEFEKAYYRLSASREATVIHSADDFKTILIDNAVDGGLISIVRERNNGKIMASAFAVARDGDLIVRDIVSENETVAEVALKSLRERTGEVGMTVIAPPGREGVGYHARGMARIVNVKKMLEIFAEDDPQLQHVIRVGDPLIADNDHTFIVKYGSVFVDDSYERKANLDVTIDIFTSIVFSSKQMGEIFNLRTARPFISLMLE